MLENKDSKDIETILNRILGSIGDDDSENKPIMIFGDVNINIHCDDCGDDVPPTSNPHVSYSFNHTSDSDKHSEMEEKAWDRFYRSNTFTG